MNTDLLDYIQELSLRDTKTLCEKTVKAAEELGELSRAVLPYENGYATTHRFIKREKILEEVADLMLCALSVAYSVGYQHDDLERMLAQKSAKWQSLQARSDRITFPVPFEIHVTIEDGEIASFTETCKNLGVKPLLLDLHLRQGGEFKDLQTSSKIISDNAGAYQEMKRISNGLTEAGFPVVREKIETVPWHPAAPSLGDHIIEMPRHCYFECHFGITVKEDQRDRLKSSVLFDLPHLHISKNVFKTYENGLAKTLLTYRAYFGTREEFDLDVSEYLRTLEQLAPKFSHFEIDKPIVEFSIFDSRISHDAAWLEGTT